MVYKKFVNKRGKIFGPYYYESYRDGVHVRKRYIGDEEDYRLWLKKKKSVEQPRKYFKRPIFNKADFKLSNRVFNTETERIIKNNSRGTEKTFRSFFVHRNSPKNFSCVQELNHIPRVLDKTIFIVITIFLILSVLLSLGVFFMDLMALN